MSERVWISWETQRRSIELAKKFGCKLFIFDWDDILRYPIALIGTLFILVRKRPKLLFVQNPSMFLSALACIYGMLTSAFVIVDRHTTFRLNKPHSGSFNIWLFMRLHYFTLKWADLTIVTNDFLADLVRKAEGRAFVLPDSLPEIKPCKKVELAKSRNLLMISSFGLDEPIYEVIEAIAGFENEDVCLYISGNYKKLDAKLPEKSPENVKFTGFLPDQDFIDLLFSVDAAMALTKSDYCMLCGCYEAISAEKPLITSKKKVLTDYFTNAIFVDSTVDDLRGGIQYLFEKIDMHREKCIIMKSELETSWNKRYDALEDLLKGIESRKKL